MGNPNAAEAGNRLRAVLSRVRSQDTCFTANVNSTPNVSNINDKANIIIIIISQPSRSKPAPVSPPHTQTSVTVAPEDPFDVHIGSPLLATTDFRSTKESVLFNNRTYQNNGRVHRPIRQRRARGSPEGSEGPVVSDGEKRHSDCFPVRREKAGVKVKEGKEKQGEEYEHAKGHAQKAVGAKEVVDSGTQTDPLTSPAKPPIPILLPGFTDPLDIALATYNPDKPASECRSAPPIGILNSPYGMNGCPQPPDKNHPTYDSDWDERLFDPVPGAGIYAGELIDCSGRLGPRDWNVVYLSLDWESGEWGGGV